MTIFTTPNYVSLAASTATEKPRPASITKIAIERMIVAIIQTSPDATNERRAVVPWKWCSRQWRKSIFWRAVGAHPFDRVRLTASRQPA